MARLKATGLPKFDAAEYADSEATIAAYLTDILAAHDPALLASALGGRSPERAIG
jgi:DNA-binding phage protein